MEKTIILGDFALVRRYFGKREALAIGYCVQQVEKPYCAVWGSKKGMIGEV